MASISNCGGCGSGRLQTMLDMGLQPLAERMTPDGERYPLRLVQCGNCRLVQLSYIVDGHEVFPPDHPYATGNTRFLREHFESLAHRLVGDGYLGRGGLIVDIGSNDGTFLKCFGDGIRRIGVEPTNQAAKSRAAGIWTAQEFFTSALAFSIARENGQAAVVTACNVLAHVPDVHDFLEGVRILLGPDGVFVTENHDLRAITVGMQIDTVYHEHLRYYSVASLSGLLDRHDLDVVRVEPVPTHGGSFRAYARRGGGSLGINAISVAGKLERLLADLHDRGSTIYGIGAATRAAPLMHYAKITDLIEAVCEVEGSEKIGRVMPGTSIPVVPDSKLIEDQPEYALLLSWHIADSLMPALREMGYRGKFIIPLPEPRVVSNDGQELR